MNPRDRNRLAKLLLSMSTDDEGMLLTEFDGFCAGIVACPDFIKLEEWLPFVIRDIAEHEVANADADAAEILIRAHYNAVSRALEASSAGYTPIFDWDAVTCEILWEPWVCGFRCAMQLRPDAWENMLENGRSDVVAAITNFEALFRLAVGESALPAKTASALSDNAPDIILKFVKTMFSRTIDDQVH